MAGYRPDGGRSSGGYPRSPDAGWPEDGSRDPGHRDEGNGYRSGETSVRSDARFADDDDYERNWRREPDAGEGFTRRGSGRRGSGRRGFGGRGGGREDRWERDARASGGQDARWQSAESDADWDRGEWRDDRRWEQGWPDQARERGRGADWSRGGSADSGRGGDSGRGRDAGWDRGGRADPGRGGRGDWGREARADWDRGQGVDVDRGGRGDWNRGQDVGWDRGGRGDSGRGQDAGWDRGGRGDSGRGQDVGWDRGGRGDSGRGGRGAGLDDDGEQTGAWEAPSDWETGSWETGSWETGAWNADWEADADSAVWESASWDYSAWDREERAGRQGGRQGRRAPRDDGDEEWDDPDPNRTLRMRRGQERADPTGGADGNERLTGMTGGVLLLLFAAEGVTILGIHQLLTLHFFFGMLLVGPVVLKVSSTVYRFFRYYTGAAEYTRKGPPAPLLRLLGPFVVMLSVTVVGSGVMLAVVGPAGAGTWLFIHKASFVLWFGAMTIHVLAYVWRVPSLISGDLALRAGRRAGVVLGGRPARWLLLSAALLTGLLLASMTVSRAGLWVGYFGG